MNSQIMLILFAIIMFIIDRIVARIQFLKLTKEVKKAKLYCDLIELESDIQTDCLDSDLSKYKFVKKYLATTNVVIDKLTIHFNLDEILFVESRNKSYTKFKQSLIKEYMSVDLDIKELVARKAHIVNGIASLKHPIAHKISIAKNALIPNILLVLLEMALVTLKFILRITEKIDIVKKLVNKSEFLVDSKNIYNMATTNNIIIENE